MDKKKIVLNNFYRLVNFYQIIHFYTSFRKIKKYTKRNLELKNKHLGERCFVLGNGPSLNTVDLSKIQNEKIFTVNFFAKSDLYQELHPDYYCIIDGSFLSAENIDFFKFLAQSCDTNLLVEHWAISTLNEINDCLGEIYFSFSLLRQYGDFTSYDFSRLPTGSVNVVCHCIKWALYMGFSEIYLLGCDFNQFAKPAQAHFYKSNLAHENIGYKRGFDLMYSSQALFDHYALEKESRKIGSRIFNATTDSLIDAYEFVDFDCMINNQCNTNIYK